MAATISLWALAWLALAALLVAASPRLGRLRVAVWLCWIGLFLLTVEDALLTAWLALASPAGAPAGLSDPDGIAGLVPQAARAGVLNTAAWAVGGAILAGWIARRALAAGRRWAWWALSTLFGLVAVTHAGTAWTIHSRGLPFPTPAAEQGGFGWEPIAVGLLCWGAALTLSYGRVFRGQPNDPAKPAGGIARSLYNFGYRYFRVPWDVGPRRELVDLLKRGCFPPGRAIDLGCGTGANAVFLAQHGFDVTGVDFAPAALVKARRRAQESDVIARFVEDDLTYLRNVTGPFDLLVDYGALDDLPLPARDKYVEQVVPLARPSAQFLLWCFEWPPRWWERFVPFAAMSMAPGEVERRFGPYFEIERIAGTEVPDPRAFIAGYACYLMTRRV